VRPREWKRERKRNKGWERETQRKGVNCETAATVTAAVAAVAAAAIRRRDTLYFAPWIKKTFVLFHAPLSARDNKR